MIRIVSFCCVMTLVLVGGCKGTSDNSTTAQATSPGLWARNCDIGVGPSTDPSDGSGQSWVQVQYAYDTPNATIDLEFTGGYEDDPKDITIAQTGAAGWSKATTIDDTTPRDVQLVFSPDFEITIKGTPDYVKNFSYTYDGTSGPTYPNIKWEPDSVISSSYNLLVINWKGYTVQLKIKVQ